MSELLEWSWSAVESVPLLEGFVAVWLLNDVAHGRTAPASEEFPRDTWLTRKRWWLGLKGYLRQYAFLFVVAAGVPAVRAMSGEAFLMSVLLSGCWLVTLLVPLAAVNLLLEFIWDRGRAAQVPWFLRRPVPEFLAPAKGLALLGIGLSVLAGVPAAATRTVVVDGCCNVLAVLGALASGFVMRELVRAAGLRARWSWLLWGCAVAAMSHCAPGDAAVWSAARSIAAAMAYAAAGVALLYAPARREWGTR